jgi:elongation factor G
VGVRVVLSDGQYHPVDSSDLAFQTAARDAFKQVYLKAQPQILEPIMKLSVEGPSEFAGNVFASINQRRGMIVSSVEDFSRVDAEVPLSEMFGYSNQLRSMTQGKAEFTMEFLKYGKVPANIAELLQKEYQEKKKKEASKR